MRCPRCGHENDDTAVFCSICYKQLRDFAANSPQRAAEAKDDDSSSWKSGIVSWLVLAAVILGGLYGAGKMISLGWKVVASTNVDVPAVNDTNFPAEVLQVKDTPVLVQYYTAWYDDYSRDNVPAVGKVSKYRNNKLKVVAYKITDKSSRKRVCQEVYLNGEKVSENVKYTPDKTVNEIILFCLYRNYMFPDLKTEDILFTGVRVCSAKDFRQLVLNSDKPVIIDVSDNSCPHAARLLPDFEETARQYSDVADFYYANYAESFVRALHVTKIPTVITFRNGVEIGRSMGATSSTEVNMAKILQYIYPDILARATGETK